MSSDGTLGNTDYRLPEGIQNALDLEREAIEEYRNIKAVCSGSNDRSCCLGGLTFMQIEAVKALIASFPAQDDQLRRSVRPAL